MNYRYDFCDGRHPTCRCDEKIYRPPIPLTGKEPELVQPEQVPKEFAPPPPLEAPRFEKFKPSGGWMFPNSQPAQPPPRSNIFHDDLGNLAMSVLNQGDQGDQRDQRDQGDQGDQANQGDQRDQGDQADQKHSVEQIDQENKDPFGGSRDFS